MIVGVLLGLTAAAAWSLANVAIQGASRSYGALSAIVWSLVCGTIGMTLVSGLISGPPGAWSLEGGLAVAVGGISACAAYLGLFDALERGQLAVISPIIACWAIVSVLADAVAGEQTVPLIRWVGVVSVVGGNVLLVRTAGAGAEDPAAPRGPSTSRRALVSAAISAVGFGIMVPAADIAGAELGRLWAIPGIWTVELLVMVPILSVMGLLGRAPAGPRAWLPASAVGVCESVGFAALSLGLAAAPVSVVAPAASCSTGLTVLVGVLVFRERIGWAALAGASVASVGVVLTAL